MAKLENRPAGRLESERQAVSRERRGEKAQPSAPKTGGVRKQTQRLAKGRKFKAKLAALRDQVEWASDRRFETKHAARLDRHGQLRPGRRHARGF